MESKNSHFLSQTRSQAQTHTTFIQAMLDPNADFGGLYTFPTITPFDDITRLYELEYRDICKEVFKQLHIDIDSAILESALQSYNTFRNNIAYITDFCKVFLCCLF